MTLEDSLCDSRKGRTGTDGWGQLVSILTEGWVTGDERSISSGTELQSYIVLRSLYQLPLIGIMGVLCEPRSFALVSNLSSPDVCDWRIVEPRWVRLSITSNYKLASPEGSAATCSLTTCRLTTADSLAHHQWHHLARAGRDIPKWVQQAIPVPGWHQQLFSLTLALFHRVTACD